MSRAAATAPRSNFARVFALVWLQRAALGWLLALPAIAVVSGSGVPNLFDGDRALFESGALWLAELGRVTLTPSSATLKSFLPYFGLILALWTLPEGMLAEQSLDAFASAREVFRAVFDRLGRLLVLSLAELVAKGVVLLIAMLLGNALDRLALTPNEALRELPAALCTLLAAVALAGVSVLSDTRRSLLFQRPELGGAALDITFSIVRRQVWELGAGYLLRFGLGALLVAIAARLTELIDVSRTGAARVLAVLLLHQSVLGLLTWLEALWLARVNACVASQPPAARL